MTSAPLTPAPAAGGPVGADPAVYAYGGGATLPSARSQSLMVLPLLLARVIVATS
jgi:hypothetical protein